MQALCKYFASNTRLTAGLTAQLVTGAYDMYCVDGAVLKNRMQYKVLSKYATVLLNNRESTAGDNARFLLSSDKEFLSKNNGVVEGSEVKFCGVPFQLVQFLLWKTMNTSGNFEVEFQGDKEVIAVSAYVHEDTGCKELQATVRGVSGEAYVVGETSVQQVLKSCTALSSFSYTTSCAEYEKQVTVRRGIGEMYRELSRFLGRTICFVSRDGKNGTLVEQYIGPTSALEVTLRKGNARFYKKLSVYNLAGLTPFACYLTLESIDDVCFEQGRIAGKNKNRDR